MIPSKEDVELIKLYVELHRLVEYIAEERCKRSISRYCGPARNWANRALKYLRKHFSEETLREVGVDRETREIIGYF